MPGVLAAIGAAHYNGFDFPPLIDATVSGTVIPVTDGRATKCVRHALDIDFVVHPGVSAEFPGGQDIDDGMEALRNVLTQTGKTLKYSDKGFGDDFIFNTTNYDVLHGPKPTTFRYKTYSEGQAARVRWGCEVNVAECKRQYNPGGSIMDWSYEATWRVVDGYTTRTINGRLEVPARVAGNVSTDFADRYLERIRIAEPVGFKRETTHSTSADGRVLTVVVVDTEMKSPNPYPRGIVSITAPFTAESSSYPMAGLWNGGLSCSIETAPGIPRGVAWNVWNQIYEDRISHAGKGRWGRKENKPSRFIILKKLSVTEDPFSRTLKCRAMWTFATSLKTLVQATGMFQPLKGVSWTDWHESMKLVHSPRGVAGMRETAADRAVVDLCGSQGISIGGSDTNYLESQSGAGKMADPCPPPDQSWISYRNDTMLVQDTATVVHRRLTSAESVQPTVPSPSDNQTQLKGRGSQSATQRPIARRVGPTKYLLLMEGVAVRACYSIPLPEITTYGDQPVQQIGQPKFKQRQLRLPTGTTVYAAKWEVLYLIQGTPTGDLSIARQIDSRDYA